MQALDRASARSATSRHRPQLQDKNLSDDEVVVKTPPEKERDTIIQFKDLQNQTKTHIEKLTAYGLQLGRRAEDEGCGPEGRRPGGAADQASRRR